MTDDNNHTVKPAVSLPLAVLPVVQMKQSHDLALSVDDVDASGVLAVVPIVDGVHPGDTLTLRWQGFYQGLPEQEWSQSIRLDESNIKHPVRWNIPRIQVVIIEGEHAEVSYELITADGETSCGPLQVIRIVPPESPRLRAPYVKGHDSNLPIDPGRFPDGVILQFDADAHLQVDDYVVLYAQGRAGDSQIIKSLHIDASLTGQAVLEFQIEPPWLENQAGAQVSAFYQFARQGVAKSSESLTLNVLEPLDLPAPLVEKAYPEGESARQNGYLLALDATTGVYTNVPESVSLVDSDQVEMHWQGHPEGGRYIAQSPVNTDNRRRFFIPASAVAANMGTQESKRFDVFYRFTFQGGQAQDSDAFGLRILPLEQSRYPTIQWARLEGASTLSLREVAANGEDLRLDAWVFMAQGQQVTIEVTGVAAAGGAARTVVRNALPVSLQEMVEKKVMSKLPRSFLQSLKINEYITLIPKVSFDGGETLVFFNVNNGVKLVE